MHVLETVDAVIEAVGGTTAAARLAGLKTPGAASLWSARGRIPPDKWFVFEAALRERGLRARPSIFGFDESAK